MAGTSVCGRRLHSQRRFHLGISRRVSAYYRRISFVRNDLLRTVLPLGGCIPYSQLSLLRRSSRLAQSRYSLVDGELAVGNDSVHLVYGLQRLCRSRIWSSS